MFDINCKTTIYPLSKLSSVKMLPLKLWNKKKCVDSYLLTYVVYFLESNAVFCKVVNMFINRHFALELCKIKFT